MLFTNSISFPNTFNIDTGQTNLDSEIISINRCLGLLFTSAKGELFGDPDFGSNLYTMLFEHDAEIMIDEIQDMIVEDAAKFESRVVIEKNGIEINRIDGERVNAFNIKISYSLKNNPSVFSTSFYMEENNNG